MKSSFFALPAVLVMARFWQSGPVKTRLAADLGQKGAREVYRQMVERLWQSLEDPRLARLLWVSPAQALESCSLWLPRAHSLFPQPPGNLGARMQQAFKLAHKHPWAAVIGTDCPAINSNAVLAAGAALDHADVVLSPTFDGGYALMALRQPQPQLFEDIPWSTSKVLATTLERAADLGLQVSLGLTLRDLDDLDDLKQLRMEGLVD